MMNRRDLLLRGSAALSAAAGCSWLGSIAGALAAPVRFKYALCNEVFEKRDFASACREMKAAGFDGVEIAPFTLADHLDELSPARRTELRNIMKSEGLQFAGLHWLLITPKWLHLTTAEKDIRVRSWDYFLKLIDFCADMGKGIMVLGSPKQRGSRGNTPAEAAAHLRDGLARVAPHASERGCTILIESLPSKDTDVINTLDQAVQMVREINHPAIQTMFDFHNATDEHEPVEVLVRRHFAHIRHIHVNEMDGRYPGTGDLDFLPVLKVLGELNYRGWVSVEVFDFKPSAEHIARESMKRLKALEAELNRRGKAGARGV